MFYKYAAPTALFFRRAAFTPLRLVAKRHRTLASYEVAGSVAYEFMRPEGTLDSAVPPGRFLFRIQPGTLCRANFLRRFATRIEFALIREIRVNNSSGLSHTRKTMTQKIGYIALVLRDYDEAIAWFTNASSSPWLRARYCRTASGGCWSRRRAANRFASWTAAVLRRFVTEH